MSGYGPLASMANTGTSMLSGLFSKDIGDYVGKTFDNPLIGKIAGIALPALLAGGAGAALGGKYGWGNMLPAGIMALMSQMGGEEGAGGQAAPAAMGPGMGEGVSNNPINSTRVNYNDPTSITSQSLSEAATGKTGYTPETATPATQAKPQEAKKTGTIMDSLGDLFNTPEGKLIVSMMLSNMTSGALGNASGAEYQYNQQRNQARDAYNKQMGDQAYIRSWYS